MPPWPGCAAWSAVCSGDGVSMPVLPGTPGPRALSGLSLPGTPTRSESEASGFEKPQHLPRCRTSWCPSVAVGPARPLPALTPCGRVSAAACPPRQAPGDGKQHTRVRGRRAGSMRSDRASPGQEEASEQLHVKEPLGAAARGRPGPARAGTREAAEGPFTRASRPGSTRHVIHLSRDPPGLGFGLCSSSITLAWASYLVLVPSLSDPCLLCTCRTAATQAGAGAVCRCGPCSHVTVWQCHGFASSISASDPF